MMLAVYLRYDRSKTAKGARGGQNQKLSNYGR